MTIPNSPTERIPDLTSYTSQDTSWAASLSNYMKMKHHAPQLDAEQYRYCRGRSFEWRMEQFDPVRQIYTDSQQENHMKQRDMQQQSASLHRAQEKQMRKEATRDFLKGWDSKVPEGINISPGEYMDKARVRRPDIPHATDECQEDFYSNIGKRTKLNWSMRERNPYHVLTMQEKGSVGSVQGPPAPQSTSAHEYIKQQTQNAYKKYRAQHFDPVLQRFLNPNREVTHMQETKRKERALQSLKEDRLPTFLKTAESQAYDLFNHQVKKEELIPRVERNMTRASSTKKYTHGQELLKQLTRDRNKVEVREQKRVERRFKERSNRLAASVQHGFNIIHNKPFVGVDSMKPPVSLHVLEKKSMWDTLNGQQKVYSERPARMEKLERNTGVEPKHIEPRLAQTARPLDAPPQNLRPQTTFSHHKPPVAGSARAAIVERRRSGSYGVRSASGVDRPRTAGFL